MGIESCDDDFSMRIQTLRERMRVIKTLDGVDFSDLDWGTMTSYETVAVLIAQTNRNGGGADTTSWEIDVVGILPIDRTGISILIFSSNS